MGRKRVRVLDADCAQLWPLRSDERVLTACDRSGVAALVSVTSDHVCFRGKPPENTSSQLPFDGKSLVFSTQQSSNRYFIAYPKRQSDAPWSPLVLVDTVEQRCIQIAPPPASDAAPGECIHGCVDETGRHVALVVLSTTNSSWKLWCWRQSNDAADGTGRVVAGEWTALAETVINGSSACFVGQFFQSPALGTAFLLVSVALNKDTTAWIVSAQVHRVSRTWQALPSSRQVVKRDGSGGRTRLDIQHRVWLSSSRRWVIIYDGESQRIQCVAVALFGPSTAKDVPSIALDSPSVDVAFDNDVAVVLSQCGGQNLLTLEMFPSQETDGLVLAVGQVRLIQLPSSNESPVIAIRMEDSSGIDMELRFPAQRKSDGVRQFRRIQWIPSCGQLFASRDDGVFTCQLAIEEEVVDASRSQHVHPRTQPAAPPTRKRLHVEAMAEAALSNKDSSVSDLIAVARTAITANHSADADLALALLAVVLLRVLKRLGMQPADSDDSAGDSAIHVGIVEMLVAQLVTVDARTVHRIAHKIVHAPVFHSRMARVAYFEPELHIIIASVADEYQGVKINHVQEIFLKAFHKRVADLLVDIKQSGDTSMVHEITLDTLAQAQRLLQIETRRLTNPVDQLHALMLCYTLACGFYSVDHVALDVEGLLRATNETTGGSEAMLHRTSFVACFLRIRCHHVIQAAHGSFPVDAQHQDIILRLAAVAGVSVQLVHFCALLDVSQAFSLFSCSQRVLDSSVRRAIVHRSISKLIGTFRSVPLIRRNNPRSASDHQVPDISSLEQVRKAAMEAFIKIVTRVASDTSTETTLGGPATPLQDPGLVHSAAVLCQPAIHHMRRDLHHVHPQDDSTLTSLFARVFLYQELWAPTSDTSIQEAAECGRRTVCGNAISGRVLGASTWRPTTSAPGEFQAELRSVATMLWSFWVRECCGIAKRALDQHKMRSYQDQSEREELGRLLAWCALHLKAVRLYGESADDDETAAWQLTFLEAAAELHGNAAARALAWGFSSELFPARQLRRYRVLQATLRSSSQPQDTSSTPSKDLDRLRGLVVKCSAALPASQLMALDVAITCCCDPGFQRLVWALVQRRFVVCVSASTPENASTSGKHKPLLLRAASAANVVTRSEVLRLLESQRQEIEKQIQRATVVDTSTSTTTRHPDHPQPMPTPTEDRQESPTPTARTATPTPDRSQYIIRDLDRSTSPSPPFAHSSRAEFCKTMSTHNVLKMLQLRKETRDIKHHQSAPRMVAVNLGMSQSEQEKPGSSATERSIPEPRRPVVQPLRRDDSPHTQVGLRLLHTSRQQERSVPLARKSFSLPIDKPAREIDDSSALHTVATQCVELCTTSAQTETTKLAIVQVESVHEDRRPSPVPASASPQAHDELPMRCPPPASQATGVQCDLQTLSGDHKQPVMATRPSRFPVYVELPSTESATTTTSKFLHVAKMVRDPSTQSVRTVRVESHVGSDSRDPEPPLIHGTTTSTNAEPAPDPTTVVDPQARVQRFRERYRSHYAPAAPRVDDASGLISFATLKSEMEHMKARLMELESCAETLDEEFKATHHKLERIGDAGSNTTRDKVLVQVEQALQATEDTRDGLVPSGSLAVKATRDLEDATRLLAQLETLTGGGHASR